MKKVLVFAVLMMSLCAVSFAEETSAPQGAWNSTTGFLRNCWPGNWPVFGGHFES
jgi:hypothetical protein